MFSQYFGNYILNRGLIKPDQLAEVLEVQASTHLKLGVLAVNSGYMTASQVTEVHQMQTRIDKKFGEIAIEMGYLDETKLQELLSTQKLGHLLLAQAIVDKGYLTLEQLQAALEDYKKDNGLSDQQFKSIQQGDVDEIVKTFVNLENIQQSNVYIDYISLLIRNIIRFIEGSPMLGSVRLLDDYSNDWIVCQEVIGKISFFTAIAAGDQVFVDLASKYAGENIKEPDELAQSSVAEFLNLHNGIFLVNMSNRGIELELKPQRILNRKSFFGIRPGFVLPVILSSGLFELIISDSVPGLR